MSLSPSTPRPMPRLVWKRRQADNASRRLWRRLNGVDVVVCAEQPVLSPSHLLRTVAYAVLFVIFEMKRWLLLLLLPGAQRRNRAVMAAIRASRRLCRYLPSHVRFIKSMISRSGRRDIDKKSKKRDVKLRREISGATMRFEVVCAC